MADDDKAGETVDYSRWKASSDDVNISVSSKGVSRKPLSTKIQVVILIVCILISMVLGIIFGYMIRVRVHANHIDVGAETSNTQPLTDQQTYQMYDHEVFSKVAQALNIDNIKSSIRARESDDNHYFPGSDVVNASSLEIKQFCSDIGLKLKTANIKKILISRPGRNGSSIFTISKGTEVTYQANVSDSQPDSMKPYIAYSHSGIASGPPVFVNYGRIEDFVAPDEYNGSICFAKLGKLNPYNIIVNADRFLCRGVVIYLDPYEYPLGMGNDRNTRLSLSAKALSGDPSTPGIASFESESLYSLSSDDVEERYFPPKIPAFTASVLMVQNALVDLRQLNISLTSKWTGAVDRVNYKYGGKSETRIVEITVNNILEQDYVHESICAIRGTVDNDKFIVVTSHHDSLGTGKDPVSGQVIMKELLATITKQKDTYKPRRSLIFLMTDGATLDIGTREWVERYIPEFTNKVIAVVNLAKTLTNGDMLAVSASPLLKTLVSDVARNTSIENIKIREVTGPYHYRSFSNDLAAPVVDASFINANAYDNEGVVPSLANLPLCCAPFDSELSPTKKAVHFHLQLLMRLANEPLYPYTLTELTDQASSGITSLQSKLVADRISPDTFRELNKTVRTFTSIIKKFHTKVMSVKNLTLPEVKYRRLNDAVLGIRNSFLVAQGVPMIDPYNSSIVTRNLNNRNCLFGSLSDNNFNSVVYPGLTELLDKGDPDSRAVQDMLWRHVTEIIQAIYRALDYTKRAIGDSDVFKL